MFKPSGRSLIPAVVLVLLTAAVDAMALSPATLDGWLKQYGAAWEARDGAAAAALFTADASYHEMPFDAPKAGRAGIESYWREVTADQRDVKFKYEAIAVNGNTGVAHWSAEFRLQSTGATVKLDGVFVLDFDASGKCAKLREWWHVGGG